MATTAPLDNLLDEYLVKKAPYQLPTNARQALVNAAPWLSLIFGILNVIRALSVFWIGAVFEPLAMFGGPSVAGSYFIVAFSLILLGVTGVLNLMAFGPLKARSMRGWRLLYYSQLVWIVSELLQYNLVGALLGGLIGLYLLFQIKSYYK